MHCEKINFLFLVNVVCFLKIVLLSYFSFLLSFITTTGEYGAPQSTISYINSATNATQPTA